MRTIVITPPAPALTWEEVATHLELAADDYRQNLVMGFVTGTISKLGPPNGWLGFAIGLQTLETRLDNWDCGSIRLPWGPVVSVESVKYIDANGIEQTIDEDQYDLIDTSVSPAYNRSWPSHRWQREAVRIQYKAGEAVISPALKLGINLMVQGQFEGTDAYERAAMSYIDPFRVYA